MSSRIEIPDSDDLAPETPLAGLLVVEIADNLAAYCGRLLASLGAEVILVEPPGGCRRRQEAEEQGCVMTPSFAWLHTGKRSVVIDPTSPNDAIALRRLIASADILLQGATKDRMHQWNISPERLRQDNPGLILASILPFGSTGPYRSYRGTESVSFALSGLMNISGNPGEPPVLAPGDQATVVGGAQMAVGILVALRAREHDGLGQDVEVSVQEAFSAQENIVSSYTGDNWRGERTGSQHRVAAPGSIYPCQDGFVHLFVSPVQQGAWDRLVDWMGPSAGVLAQEEWRNPRYRRAHTNELNKVVRAWTSTWVKQDLYVEAQKRHIPCAPVNTMSDFVEDPHIVARGFFQQAASDTPPSYFYPGSVFVVDGRRREHERRTPELGASNLFDDFN